MSGSSTERRNGNGDPLLAGINDEAPSAQEADQSQSQFARQLNRETRRRGDRRQQRNSGGNRFLYDLEPAAAADQQHVTTEWQMAAEQRPTDDLVHGVVPADVLAQDEQFARRSKKRRGMQSAGSTEDRLRFAQNWRQLAKYFGIEQQCGRGTPQAPSPELRDGRLPAHTAGRPSRKSSRRVIFLEAHAGIEGHANEIFLECGIVRHPQRHQVLSL